MITKKLKRSEDMLIEFTDQELNDLKIEKGDKFSVHLEDDGSVLLKKYVNVEVDISEWSRDVLEMLVIDSIKKDLSINDVIVEILNKQILKEDESQMKFDF